MSYPARDAVKRDLSPPLFQCEVYQMEQQRESTERMKKELVPERREVLPPHGVEEKDGETAAILQSGEEGERVQDPLCLYECVAISRRLCRASFSRMLWIWLFTVWVERFSR